MSPERIKNPETEKEPDTKPVSNPVSISIEELQEIYRKGFGDGFSKSEELLSEDEISESEEE